MNLNFSKYSKIIKVLSIIPIIVGFLTLIESFIPNKQIDTFVVSKKEDYRSKFGNTTYNIYFENNNDQFTEEIFNSLNEGDEVILNVSFFTEEVSYIAKKATNQTIENSTYEVYIKYLFSIIFLIPLFFIFKKRSLSSKQSKYLVFIIIFSLVSFYRIVKLNLN